jgi:UDP-N-acetylmuramyl pentapeptide synthase
VTAAAVRTFGLGADADVRADRHRELAAWPAPSSRLTAPWGTRRVRSATPGRHLVPHALAAAAAAEHLGVPLDEVEAALAGGSRAAHRMAVTRRRRAPSSWTTPTTPRRSA